MYDFIMVERSSKIFFLFFALLVFLSVGVTYYKYVVLGDFETLTDEEIFQEEFQYWE